MSTISVYTSHDRELLFHGPDTSERLKLDPPRVIYIDGVAHAVYNVTSEPVHLSLWVSA